MSYKKKDGAHSKQYRTSLYGTLRKDFEFYASSQDMTEADAMRECIKAHVRKKDTTPDTQLRLRTLEQLLRELLTKLS